MLKIYTNQITPRISYTMDLVVRDLLGLDCHITDDVEDFESFAGPKFSYSNTPLGDELHFQSNSLLFEDDIKPQQVDKIEGEIPGLFPVSNRENKRSVLNYDPFAATFYMVTRYEEYLPHERDLHDRFMPKESIAHQYDFMHIPVVNYWAIEVGKMLKNSFPELEIKEHQYSFIPTYDIDIAWAYLNRPFIRTMGGFFRSLAKLNFKAIGERAGVLSGRRKDPFDTYDYLDDLDNKYHLLPIYFFILGDRSKFDKNMPFNNEAFSDLIQSIASRHTVGMHPSYQSNEDFNRVKMEKARMEEIVGRQVKISRQHYLKLSFPSTYRNLINLGVEEDFTMGYTSHVGFRAGICTPFYFFDLEKNQATGLKLFPFAAMDASLQYYMNLKAEEILEAVKPAIDAVKGCSGQIILLTHNNTFSENGEWVGWRKAYEDLIEYAIS